MTNQQNGTPGATARQYTRTEEKPNYQELNGVGGRETDETGKTTTDRGGEPGLIGDTDLGALQPKPGEGTFRGRSKNPLQQSLDTFWLLFSYHRADHEKACNQARAEKFL